MARTRRAPEKAVKNAFVYAIDAYCKQTNKYTKSESKITFQDVADCLVLVTNCFSTQTSYENQTKKAITNKFVQDAMAEFSATGCTSISSKTNRRPTALPIRCWSTSGAVNRRKRRV